MDKTAKRPKFMEEDWLKTAIDELDIHAMSADKYDEYILYKVREAEAERARERLENEAKTKGIIEGKIEGITEGIVKGKIEAYIKLTDWADEVIASNLNVNVGLVKTIREELSKEKH